MGWFDLVYASVFTDSSIRYVAGIRYVAVVNSVGNSSSQHAQECLLVWIGLTAFNGNLLKNALLQKNSFSRDYRYVLGGALCGMGVRLACVDWINSFQR